jgi:ribosome biogenesis GTPase / thiamine phosphate phosphatase
VKALVYKSTGSWYSVKPLESNNGFDRKRFYQARIKGIFKIDEITSTNPVAVGDLVEIEAENEIENTVVIIRIYDRRNYINRQSPRVKYQHHIIAANLDQSILLATLKEPRTSQGFVDRFLVASEMYHVTPVVVINKSDLFREKEEKQFSRWKTMYENSGYRIFAMSVKQKDGIDEFTSLLNNKTTLLSGHSGVGKSSLLNIIIPGIELKIQEVSGWSGKGLHTTTFAEMFDLPSNRGKIIDTPGMREFGLIDVSRQELSHYFPEMRDRLQDCKFNNCQHINEPGCAIKEAVMNGEIDENRYVSYVTILESIEEKTY